MGERVKTPTVIQMEAVECGAASLGMVLGYYGCFVPLEELRVTCGVSRDGSKASNIANAAKHYGLDAEVGFYDIDELKTLTYPLVIFWNHNHFMVLEGFKNDTVYINDPKTGPRKMGLKEFKQGFSEVGILFKLTDKFKKRKKSNHVLKEFFSELKGMGSPLTFIVAVTLLITLPTIAVPVFSQVFIDDYLLRAQQNWLHPLLSIMFVVLIIQFLLVLLQRSVLKRVETKLAIKFNQDLIHHMIRLPMSFFSQRQAGDLITRLQANDNIAKLLSGPLGITLISMMQAVIYLGLMFGYSWLLALVVLLLSAINIASYHWVKKKREDLSIVTKQENAHLTSITMGGISMLATLKSTGSENDLFTKWQNQLIQYLNAYQSLSFINTLLTGLPIFIKTLTNALILGIGAWLAIQGSLSVGGIVAFQALFLIFDEPIQQFVDLGGQIQQIEADFRRVEDVKHYKEQHYGREETPQKSLLNKHDFSGKIEIIDLTFGYSRLEKPLFDKLNLTIEPGERVALVGLSGSGKSTLGKLISGLYTPWSGQILIDGVPVESIPPIERAQIIAVVSQDKFFFRGSVRENLSLWDLHYDERELISSTKNAGIYDVISSAPGGFDYNLDEGAANLSGGQSQRLEIARALLTKPTIIILDEATSALDTLVEFEVDKNLRSFGMTSIIIAHRLSTIRDADKIFVFKYGSIVDSGTHESLLAKKSELYTQLVNTG